MSFQEKIASRSKEELVVMLDDADRRLFALRSQRDQERKLEKPHLIRATRKERAQILTQIALIKKKRVKMNRKIKKALLFRQKWKERSL